MELLLQSRSLPPPCRDQLKPEPRSSILSVLSRPKRPRSEPSFPDGIRSEFYPQAISRERLVSVGSLIDKFTKSGQFRLTVHALDLLAAHTRNKVWLKPSAENSFMYGNPVLKSHLGRITENTRARDRVVVYSMADLPLGFGVPAWSTQDCRLWSTTGLMPASTFGMRMSSDGALSLVNGV